MAEPTDFVARQRARLASIESAGLAKGGDGGDNGGMDNRLTILETRLDTLLPMLATKGDVSDTKAAISEAKSDVIKWISTVIIAMSALVVTVLAFMINRALPVQPSAPSAPVMIFPQPQAAPPAK